jgi:hypothetical protein
MTRELYEIEWTHDDGMDQHREYANLTAAEAIAARSLLESRGALNVEVAALDGRYALTYAALVEVIDEDLPQERTDR